MELNRVLSYRFPLVRGEDVRAVQLALIGLKMEPPCGDADGIFGAQTDKSVRGFQHRYNQQRGTGEPLDEDGKVDDQTWAALITTATRSGVTATPVKVASDVITPPAPPPQAAVQGAPMLVIPRQMLAPVPGNEQAQTLLVKGWLMQNFADEIDIALKGTPFDANLVCAIAARETGIKWLPWVRALAPDQVLARCVFDASGDYPGTSRSAFPRNTAAFRDRYPGDAIVADLIAEANQTRALQNWGPKDWVYKGYGIFQYDLQYFETDEAWFRKKEWCTIAGCLSRLLIELKTKHRDSGGQMRDTVRRYNGSGPRAEEYASNVMQRYEWCKA